MTTKKPSRGIRNHNPGNIRLSKDKWQGLSATQTDKEFFQFKGPEWGIRALARVLISYQDKYGLRTVERIIRRWAPPNENPTPAYVAAVLKKTGFGKEEQLNMHEFAYIAPLVKVIIQHENGVQPYDDATINQGLALAGIEVPTKPLTKSRTIKGATVAAAGTVGSALTDVGADVVDAHAQLAPLADYIPWLQYGLLVLVLAGIGIAVYARVTDAKARIA